MRFASRLLFPLSLLTLVVCVTAQGATPPAFDWVSPVESTPAAAAERDFDQDVIVFVANQSWMSRIYVLDTAGNVLAYHHYDYYIFCDVEVIDNELYAVDWIAPRVYRVDIETGALDVIVDDWSLYYMYDVAFDGSYFYALEWSLNRYAFDGSSAGSTSFGPDLRGSAWDGTYYWTLSDAGEIQCWDLSAWPTVTEVPGNNFTPPSPDCRGLWFDGQHFWSAEGIEQQLGWIYVFDYDGTVVDQWLAPAFEGYSAALIRGPLLGDLNCDGVLNAADIDPFVLALTDSAGYAAAYPDCEIMLADVDGDGSVNAADIDPFVALLTGAG